MLNDGKLVPAVRKLEAFVHEVEAMVQAGILSVDQAQPLLDAAADAIAELTGS